MRHRVRLAKDIARHVQTGHPWIYREALSRPGRLAPGTVVDVVDRRGARVARGYYDPHSPIAVRVLRLDGGPVDGAFVEERLAAALELRRQMAHRLDGDAARLVNGEGDRMPGLILDRYGRTAVVQLDGDAAEAFWAPHGARIAAALGAHGFPVDRVWHKQRGRPLVGDAPPVPVIIREGQAAFEVDVVHGQKTGFFLDQRDNRKLVGRLAAGAEVLNLFSYTGGFSVLAALGGAKRVTSVDGAAPAIEAARRNLERNGIDPSAHALVVADAFELLARECAAGRAYDLVVCDPPSFAPSERARPRALGAYRRLNALCARVLAPEGLLVTASCSSHVNEADFLGAVALGLCDAKRTGRLVDLRGAAPDHPVVPAFPEGRYLKLAVLAC